MRKICLGAEESVFRRALRTIHTKSEQGETVKSLIAEDDFTGRLILQKILSPFGETTVVVNGEEAIQAFALALAENHPYDVICLDIMMPKCDGQTVLKEIRRLEVKKGIVDSNAKVIMITSAADKNNVMTAMKENCNAYLIKPIDGAKLISKLRELGLVR